MLGSTDWAGISTMIAAISAAAVAIIGALASLKTNRRIDTGNGRTIGESVADARAVARDTNARVSSITAEPPVETVDPLPPAS